MFIGKMFLGLLGLFAAGLPGLLVGLVVGHLFDRGAAQAINQAASEKGQLGSVFFEASFLTMGRMAKADGQVSPEEIRTAEAVITRMGLSEAGREEAIATFRRGKEEDEAWRASVGRLRDSFSRKPEALALFLEIQINMAIADGHLDLAEVQLLREIGGVLGIPTSMIEELLRRMQGEYRFTQGAGADFADAGGTGIGRLKAAYETLGVSEDNSDAEIKTAYRRLMNQHHPDKLMAEGVPEDMMQAATERTRAIQEAWELVKKERGIR